ncbi:uncharacterized protein LOC100277965 [Zea mays]|uniref:DNA-binding bromodomain-containing protein n=2 Tax=Zea mays TaxID=4577 RepID=A0A1D6I782_MAIZE|nr:uncharacterized protein LOC100277965 [Zea mays]ONM55924.1 DNA-binding bromodomain-containing protein [Zea mays]
MADGTDVSPESEATAAAGKSGEIWGTLEELLLACAVTRHGTASWDSVAMEVQTRIPVAARPGLTPHSCRLRFRHLHRRFSTVGSGGVEEAEEDPDASAAEGWVDELRRLRVAELRRDVERCDLSIGTLQSKVKRLKAEREQRASGEAVSDHDRLSSEEPGCSCRESNSTDLKPPKHPSQLGDGSKEEKVAKQEASVESAVDSKDSSEVRSSASLCRRRRGSGNAEEEEAEAEASKSSPLTFLLDAVLAKLGCVLDRLRENDSEESAMYRDTIRRHVDLETLRRRLNASAGSRADDDSHSSAHELYRDLLLLCTNIVVFFPGGTPENSAAVEARALVTGHASAVLHKPKQENVAVAAPAPASADIVGSLIEKGKPLIVCRKRSSIAKAAASARKEENTMKGETAEETEDEKKSVAAATKDKTWGVRTKKSRGGKNSAGPGRNLADGADGPRKGAGAGTDGLAKKRNAVDFLKRLNQSPPRKRGSGSHLGTTRKRPAAMEEQTTKRKRGTGRKEGTGRGGSRRGGKAAGAKRGVGRPQKRGLAPATPPPSKRTKTNSSRSEKSLGTGKRGGRRQVG